MIATTIFSKTLRSSLKICKRSLSTNTIPTNVFEKEKKSFESSYPVVKQCILNEVQITHKYTAYILEQLLDHQLLNARHFRGLLLIHTFKHLNPNTENTLPIYVMAWIQEIFQGIVLLVDDIIDKGIYRRNKLAWHIGKEDEVVPFTVLLFSAAQTLLSKFCKNTAYYTAALELLNEHLFLIMDSEINEGFPSPIRTAEKDTWLKVFKTHTVEKSIYTTELPMRLAAYAAFNRKVDFSPELVEILKDYGYYIQIQNEATDFIYERGTDDIRQGKSTWFYAKAMQDGTFEDRYELTKYYGVNYEPYAKKITDIYDKLDLKNKFAEHEIEVTKTIKQTMENLPEEEAHFKEFIPKIKDLHNRLYLTYDDKITSTM